MQLFELVTSCMVRCHGSMNDVIVNFQLLKAHAYMSVDEGEHLMLHMAATRDFICSK